jgi:hypothetical protein
MIQIDVYVSIMERLVEEHLPQKEGIGKEPCTWVAFQIGSLLSNSSGPGNTIVENRSIMAYVESWKGSGIFSIWNVLRRRLCRITCGQ